MLATVGMKAGLMGIVAFGIMIGLGVLAAVRGPRWSALAAAGVDRHPGVDLTQSFATTGYGPFALGLLTSCRCSVRGQERPRAPRPGIASAEAAQLLARPPP